MKEPVTIKGRADGPSMLVFGAVHGNERCGPEAIRRFLNAHRGAVKSGRITLVEIVNERAYEQNTRYVDHDLNRILSFDDLSGSYEGGLVAPLKALMAEHDFLLDLHSFSRGDRPFVLVGPRNNDGIVEPFARQAEEERLAMATPVATMAFGWMAAYWNAMLEYDPAKRAEIESGRVFGIGTTETMRRLGGFAVTLECGQHDDPAAPDVGLQAILNVGRAFGIIEGETMPPVEKDVYRIREVAIRRSDAHTLMPDLINFAPIPQGCDVITGPGGVVLRADAESFAMFPNYAAPVGAGFVGLSEKSDRFAGYLAG